jgi:hypothetical protein
MLQSHIEQTPGMCHLGSRQTAKSVADAKLRQGSAAPGGHMYQCFVENTNCTPIITGMLVVVCHTTTSALHQNPALLR